MSASHPPAVPPSECSSAVGTGMNACSASTTNPSADDTSNRAQENAGEASPDRATDPITVPSPRLAQPLQAAVASPIKTRRATGIIPPSPSTSGTSVTVGFPTPGHPHAMQHPSPSRGAASLTIEDETTDDNVFPGAQDILKSLDKSAGLIVPQSAM